MTNPILQRLNNRAPQNNLASLISQLKSGNPDQIYKGMVQNNPQFAQFVNQNRGLSPEQIAQKYGVNIEALKNLIR